MKPVIEEYVGDHKQLSKKFSARWWKKDDLEIYKHIFGTVEMLETRQQYRTMANIKFSRLYSNLETMGVFSGMYTAPINDTFMPNRVSLNVVKSCVDTSTAKIAKTKPRPIFLTEGGDWKLQQRAKDLTMFLDGAFDTMGLYAEKQKSFRDAGILGTGAVKFYPEADKKQICCERTIIEELLVDDADGLYGKPQNLYQRRLVNKEVLKEMFPGNDDAIDSSTHHIPSTMNSDILPDLVKVIECWHLPSGPNAGDGKHVICVDQKTLLSEKWDKDYFPFVFDRWSEGLLGFFGKGLAEELIGIQVEINRILKNIQLSMHLQAVPRVAVENHSQVNIQALNNDVASIIKYTGQPPVFMTPSAMAPDVYNHLWNLFQRAFEITGISQLSAQSKKPTGLDSAVALREFQDIESDRFQIVGQRYEQTFIDAARIVIDMTRDLAKDGKVVVKVSTQGGMKEINFKDVDLNDDKYILRIFPTSILPTQPAGKLQKVTELTQAGFIDKDTAMDLLDFPDIKAATDRMLAPRKIIFKTLDKMVETDIYEAPEPYFNLAMTQEVALNYYLNAKLQEVPEEKLELIRRFIEDTRTLGDIAQQGQQQAMMAAQGVAPMAPVAKPPVAPESDLLQMKGQV